MPPVVRTPMGKANRARIIGIIGGSNAEGFGTGVSGLTKPSNCTFYDIVNVGTSPSAVWVNPSGMEAGLADELSNVLGVTEAYTIVKYGQEATSLTTWNSTQAALFVAGCNTIGIKPNIIIHDFGGSDSQSAPDLAAADDRQDTLYALLRRTFGPATAFLLPQLTVLPTVSPYDFAGGVPLGYSYGIWDEQKDYTRFRPSLHHYFDTRTAGCTLQVDQAHLDLAGQTQKGRLAARIIAACPAFAAAA